MKSHLVSTLIAIGCVANAYAFETITKAEPPNWIKTWEDIDRETGKATETNYYDANSFRKKGGLVTFTGLTNLPTNGTSIVFHQEFDCSQKAYRTIEWISYSGQFASGSQQQYSGPQNQVKKSSFAPKGNWREEIGELGQKVCSLFHPS